MNQLSEFDEIWAVDADVRITEHYEITEVEGVYFYEIQTRTSVVLHKTDIRQKSECPVPTGNKILFIGFDLTNVWRCFLELGWPLPRSIIDLKFEHFLQLNLGGFDRSDCDIDYVNSLECALRTNGVAVDSTVAGAGTTGMGNILQIAKLFQVLFLTADRSCALSRGGFSIVEACMEHYGIPLDEELCGFMNGKDPSPWRSAEGELDGRTENAEVLRTIELLDNFSTSWARLNVGADLRARHRVRPFGTITGRDRPKAGEFLFLQPKWFRSVMKPKIGTALVYIDWTAFEIGVAAGLSNDPNLMAHYSKSDIYTEFGKKIGIVDSSTEKAPDSTRRILKECVLGCNYGMGIKTLADRISCDLHTAERLIEGHRKTYRRFWEFNEEFRWRSHETGVAEIGDWAMRVDGNTRQTQLTNWPVQAMAGHLLRTTCVRLVEAEIRLLSSLHDSILIEVDLNQLKETMELTETIMRDTERELLAGFSLRSDIRVVRHPDRFAGDNPETLKKFQTVRTLLRRMKSGVNQNK